MTILKIILIGIGATILMDLWTFFLNSIQIKTLDYAMVGRWIGHMFHGQFTHEKIFNSAPIKYEKIIGWTTHYLIGITFSVLLFLIYGKNWLENPAFLPAILVGLFTIIAPFFIMQPAFGFGIAAAKLPNPNRLRFLSLITHSVYGFGLFLTAIILKILFKSNL